MMRKSGMAVIWTTYPIATAHLIGLTLQYLTGRVWVADFRDPMLQDDYPVSKWQRKIFSWIERRTIQRCHAAVFTTHGARDIYQQRYPLIAKEKFHVIENGYDEDSFKEVEGVDGKPPLSQTDKITLLHSGVLYSEGRDPSTFFAAIAALKQRGVVAATNLRVVLRASGDDEHVEMLVRQHQIDDIVFVEPHVPYQQALNEMLLVDGLLVFQGSTFNTQIPAKIYEYFRARKPIFGMLDLAGETARVLRKAGFHNIADLTSANDIASELAVFIAEIRAGEAHVATEELIAASSRKHRAQQLAGIFNQIIGQRET
jgi:glycosyltransferase involved in cell wall biosynthesis